MTEQTLDGPGVNPYAAPSADLTQRGALAEAEALRQAHIGHEASVRSLGLLYYLTTVFMALGTLGLLVSVVEENNSGEVVTLLVGAIAMAALAFGWGAVGFGLRSLRPWARIPTAVLSALGLFAFPLGTLLNGYFLYLVLSKKGRMVFSAEYAEARKLTPHIKYRSIVVWIVLALLVLVALAVIVPVAMERM